MARLLNFIFGLGLGLVLGAATGWWWRGWAPPVADDVMTVTNASVLAPGLAELLVHRRYGDVWALVARGALDETRFLAALGEVEEVLARVWLLEWLVREGDSVPVLLRLAAVEESLDDPDAAFDVLLGASLQAATDETALVDAALAAFVDRREQFLLSAGRFRELDALLETLCLRFPEQAGWFLRLGELRIQLGDFLAALAPLAQIENHGTLGPLARELAESARGSNVGIVARPTGVPLEPRGSQFMVTASIDGTDVALLVDTGAAMTIVDTAVLAALGYDLDDAQRLWFATAGGAVEAPVITLASLRVGEAEISPLTVGGLQLGNGVSGLLGMNFLKHFEWRIDQDQLELQLRARAP